MRLFPLAIFNSSRYAAAVSYALTITRTSLWRASLRNALGRSRLQTLDSQNAYRLNRNGISRYVAVLGTTPPQKLKD
jgi:hypothetical protein